MNYAVVLRKAITLTPTDMRIIYILSAKPLYVPSVYPDLHVEAPIDIVTYMLQSLSNSSGVCLYEMRGLYVDCLTPKLRKL